MIKYKVSSRDLIDVVNDIKSKRLIPDAYFQRNLVWRTIHKVDFIKTILLGYPFPQIFIAKGDIDIENMTSTSCIVDGQQRMNSIIEFVKDIFKVDGKSFTELSPLEREVFLKYQVPIIDLDIKNDDPQVIEIFKRLNRTFYSLSQIEKLSTEYAPSEFMLTAKFLLNELKVPDDEDDTSFQNNPNIPPSFIDWSKNRHVSNYSKFILEGNIFTSYELARQVQLMYTLNLMSTIIGDYFNRNELTISYLDNDAYTNDFKEKDDTVEKIEFAAKKMNKIRLSKKSYWLTKANSFTLLSLFAKHFDEFENVSESVIKKKLDEFEKVVPSDYRLSAKEAVNNKRERLIRYSYLKKLLLGI